MTAQELIGELPKGLLKWQDFEEGARALYVTADSELDYALKNMLTECGLIVECVTAERLCEIGEDKYRYIVLASALEKMKSDTDAVGLLKKLSPLLQKNGRLLLVAENRLAIRFFCGDRDPYTERNFDGIENYRRVSNMDRDTLRGRLYSKAELSRMLEAAGFSCHRAYSVFPEVFCPQILFAEDYLPREELNIRIFPQYHAPETVFLEEENMYNSLIENGMFHAMANGYLIECPMDGVFSNAGQVTVSMERGRESALCTVIRRDGKVEKKPLYSEGKAKVEQLLDNNAYLKEHGVNMIDAVIENDSFVMPYLEGESLAGYFRRLARADKQEFYRQFDGLWSLILASSEEVAYDEVNWEHFDPRWDAEKREKEQKKIDRKKWREIAESESGKEDIGVILKRGYIDLVLVNGMFVGGDLVFFDQELYVENLPARAVMLRNIDFLYHGDNEMEHILPRVDLYERYGIDKYKEIFYAHIGYFLTRLRNDDILAEYHEKHRRNHELLHANRQRMNYSTQEYMRLFVEIFQNIENKKLYLFGSGNFTKKFLALYRQEYEISGILDNDPKKWGTCIDGIEILPPSVLEGQEPGTCKVIICIKNYTEVLKQVKKLGITNIGIYDIDMEYPRKQRALPPPASGEGVVKKKYHVGYVAGVFDLFHIGHLNLLRRAKEQCDYLIVGVVTDEGVKQRKKTEGFISFEERLAIVQACRYVDEAVGIPLDYYDTRDAYLKFHFDVQFSGSDYENDPGWLKKRDFLRVHGAELVFFPYTESTSSTKLKEMIDQKLL